MSGENNSMEAIKTSKSDITKRLGRAGKLRQHSLLATVTGYGVILLATFIYLFPLLYLLNVALKSPAEFLRDPTSFTQSFDFSNFTNAWERGNFASYFLNSLLYTSLATGLAVSFSLFIAFPIARSYVKWSRFWYSLFVLSLFLPNGLIPQFQLMLNFHLYNSQFGYTILKSAVGLGPFLIVGYLKSVPKELDEAASIDGCGYFRYVLQIVAPLIKPILVTTALLHAIGVWNDLIGPTIYLSNKAYYPVSLGLFAFYGQYGNDWTALAAAILIVALPLIVFYILLQRYFIDGALAGAVK